MKMKLKLFNKSNFNKYDIEIKFNEKVKYGLFPKPFFYTKKFRYFIKKNFRKF